MELKTVVGVAVLAATLRNVAPAQNVAPQGWRWLLDAPAQHVLQTDVIPPGTFSFVAMAPGWHVTMGPGGLLYDPRNEIRGRFTLQSRIALFPGEALGEYGLFVGGDTREGASRRWTAFVVRRDGSAAVLHHSNDHTEQLVPWTKHTGVKVGTAANTLRVSLDTAVHFVVNDSAIVTLPRDRVVTEGIFGFRIGSALNMHITSLDVTHRLAPVPRPR